MTHLSTDRPAPASFGVLLRRYRRAAGLTQAELAERPGPSVRGLNDLERGVRRTPRRDTVALLAAALGLVGEEHAAFAGAQGRPPEPGVAPSAAAAPLPPATGSCDAPGALAAAGPPDALAAVDAPEAPAAVRQPPLPDARALAPPVPALPLPSGTVTFLFTDIEGSTRLLQQLGAAGYAQVRAEHEHLLRVACAAHDGRLRMRSEISPAARLPPVLRPT